MPALLSGAVTVVAASVVPLAPARPYTRPMSWFTQTRCEENRSETFPFQRTSVTNASELW
jgi:hypothetical protein